MQNKVQNNYHYNLEISDILEKPKNNSSVSTQILFGEKFKILKQHKKFFKIKLINDNYSGYLKKQKFLVNSMRQLDYSRFKLRGLIQGDSSFKQTTTGAKENNHGILNIRLPFLKEGSIENNALILETGDGGFVLNNLAYLNLKDLLFDQ